MAGLINAIGLIRVSTAGQAHEDKAGIPAQREAIRKLAQQYGLNVVKTFELVDVSGASVLKNPQYLEFLNMLQRSDIQAAVSKEISRFMRPERLEDQRIIDWFGDFGITLYLPDGPMDCRNRQTRFFVSMRAGMAGLERLEIRDRMMGGKEAMRRQGKHPSAGHTLARGIGYDKKKGWYYKEDELNSVRMLLRLFLDGEHRYQRLSDMSGIPRSSVRIILLNPVYAGVMTYSTRHDLGPNGLYPMKNGKRAYRRKIQRSADEVIRIQLPLEPLITMAQHQYILNIAENLRAPRAQTKKDAIPRFTYRGFLRCGSCEDLVYSWVGGSLKDGSPKDFYYCKSRAPREREKQRIHCENRYMTRSKLEEEIDAALISRLTQKPFIMRTLDARIESIKHDSSVQQAEWLTVQIDKLEAKATRVKDMFEDGDINQLERRSRLSAIDNKLDELTRQLAALRPVTFDPSQIEKVISVFKEWSFLGMNEKRQLMEHVLPEIYVDRYTVKGVTLRLDCDSVSLPKKVAEVTICASNSPRYVSSPSQLIRIPFTKEVFV